MSLGVTILGLDGTPKMQVSISVDDHFRLMQLIGNTADTLLSQMRDYYADAEFKVQELDLFITELISLRTRCQNDNRMLSLTNRKERMQ